MATPPPKQPQQNQAQLLWTPPNPLDTPISRYRLHVNAKYSLALKHSQDLHRWTVQQPHSFWIDFWGYARLIPALPPNTVTAYDPRKSIKQVPDFFPGAVINYAENILSNRNPSAVALTELREGDELVAGVGENWSWGVLTENVRRVRSALIRSGVRKGDRVAALMSNCNWTIALFLATASMGAIFTSISPEMGLEGCISRLDQVSPTILFADSHQTYKGKRRDQADKVAGIVGALSNKPAVVTVPLQ